MLERDLQDYLYDHPSVLFPETRVLKRFREVCIDGKRVDLLYETEDGEYIVELKVVPLTREHIGQVFEYYGLMRRANLSKRYKMILVSTLIPEARKVLLEEIGVRCVEIRSIPSSSSELAPIQAITRKFPRRDAEDALLPTRPLCYDDFTTPATKSALSMSHRLLRDTLVSLQETYSEYVVVPIRMTNASSHDLICLDASEAELRFSAGGVWWAYNFGKTENMPKNDVPNISAVGSPWGFDLTINAELRTSQSVMIDRITAHPHSFDEIVRRHENLQLQMILKLERQPRFYYWIGLLTKHPGSWASQTIIGFYDEMDAEFEALRAHWISRIKSDRRIASDAQIAQLEKRNKRLNMAIRLVRAFNRQDPIWRLPYSEQRDAIIDECHRLKALVEFFR